MKEIPSTAWMGLYSIQTECFRTARDKGWWDDFLGREMTRDEIAARLCLIHSEVSEALEEIRRPDKKPGDIYFSRKKTTPEGTTVVEEVFSYDAEAKPEGVGAELADVIIRIFDLAEFLGIDMSAAIHTKMVYNKTRSHKHGGKML